MGYSVIALKLPGKCSEVMRPVEASSREREQEVARMVRTVEVVSDG